MATNATEEDLQSLYQYHDDIDEIPADMRRLLEVYSRVAPQDVLPHVLNIVS